MSYSYMRVFGSRWKRYFVSVLHFQGEAYNSKYPFREKVVT